MLLLFNCYIDCMRNVHENQSSEGQYKSKKITVTYQHMTSRSSFLRQTAIFCLFKSNTLIQRTLIFLRCMCINPTLHPSHSFLPISPSVLNHNYSSFKIFSDYKEGLISNFFPFLAEEVKRMTGSHFSHIFFLDQLKILY